MGTKQKLSESPSSGFSSRTSLGPEFDVTGPWDETEPLVWLRCSRCGCTSRYEEGDSELEEILVKGYGGRKHAHCVSCPCHTGIGLLPKLAVKREIG